MHPDWVWSAVPPEWDGIDRNPIKSYTYLLMQHHLWEQEWNVQKIPTILLNNIKHCKNSFESVRVDGCFTSRVKECAKLFLQIIHNKWSELKQKH